MTAQFEALPIAPSLLGESPFWHPEQGSLWWCDIPGKKLNRFTPATAQHRQWAFDSDPACCAPLPSGDLLLGMRDGLFRFNPETGERQLLAEPPYKPAEERFNDGKADPQGRLWMSTIYEPRKPPNAALYRWADGSLKRMADGITVGNGLGFSPDGRTMYWSDTTSARVFAFDFDGNDGSLSRQRVLAEFPLKKDGQDLATYGGRPDGATVDAEGAYWCSMFEGQRLLRLAPDGRVLQELKLPVRCPTMPCFGGPDLRTLYITTARHGRPEAELAEQPMAGSVIYTRVEVPGLPVNFVRG